MIVQGLITSNRHVALVLHYKMVSHWALSQDSVKELEAVMEQRRKIIIPLGSASEGARPPASRNGESSLPTPHFNTEATLAARPVVPLTPDRIHAKTRSRNLLLITLIVIAAVCMGIAGGLAIAFYRGLEKTESSVAAQPSSRVATVDINAPETSTGSSSDVQSFSTASASETDKTIEQPSPSPGAVATEKIDDSEKVDDSSTKRQASTAPPERTTRTAQEVSTAQESDEGQASTLPEAIESPPDERANDDRSRNRQARRRNPEDVRLEEMPREVERAGQRGLNRIREIFEGTQP